MTNLTLWGYGLQSPLKLNNLANLTQKEIRNIQASSFLKVFHKKYKNNCLEEVSNLKCFQITTNVHLIMKGVDYDRSMIIYIACLVENTLIICALGNLHYKISREKFEPEPGYITGGPRFESRFWLNLIM